MKRFIESVDRSQATLFPEHLEDWIDDDNPVRVIDAFADGLDLFGLGFADAAANEPPRVSRRVKLSKDAQHDQENLHPDLSCRVA